MCGMIRDAMAFSLSTAQHTGPLDALLSLIQEKKLDITKVALSEVTEQYLAYMDTLEEQQAEELADFLVIAAKLLLLKAARLLPNMAPEEDDGSNLEAQLRRYRLFAAASIRIHRFWHAHTYAFPRIEPLHPPDAFVPPQHVTVEALALVMQRLVDRLAPAKPLPETTIDIAVSLKEKIDAIRMLLRSARAISFFDILNRKNKTDMIVGFLAILELVKQRHAMLAQTDPFAPIMIHRAKHL